MIEPGELLELARVAAREAGELVMSMRTRGANVAETKSSPTDIVTEADRTSEALIRRRLLDARPDDGFVGEEGNDIEGSSGVSWVVDPIDGTVNYLYGLPHYAVSVAARRDGEVVAGVVHAPALEVEYAATLGGGATCNGVPIQVRSSPPLEQALISTGFSYEIDIRTRQASAVAQLIPQVGNIRRQGSCALDLCAVAAGQSDGYVEEGAYAWDHAAGGLIAAESGATFEVWTNVADRDLIVCSPAETWTEFEALVRACGFLGHDGR